MGIKIAELKAIISADNKSGLTTDSANALDVVRNFARSFITTTLRTLEESIIESATGQKGGLAGLFGNTLGSLIGGLFGFGGIKKNAAGGPILAGGLYSMNEPGAEGEWFIPTKNGYVLTRNDARQALTNAASGQMPGHVVINNHFHITTPSNHITRESQQQVAARAGMAARAALERNS
jgi:hypothetical protein